MADRFYAIEFDAFAVKPRMAAAIAQLTKQDLRTFSLYKAMRKKPRHFGKSIFAFLFGVWAADSRTASRFFAELGCSTAGMKRYKRRKKCKILL